MCNEMASKDNYDNNNYYYHYDIQCTKLTCTELALQGSLYY